MRNVLIAAVLIFVAAGPARAQEGPVGINFGAGPAFPASNFADSFDTGWNGAIGATFNVNPYIGIQAEYMYGWMGGPERSINVFPTPVGDVSSPGLIESNHQLHVGTFNLVYNPLGPERSNRMVGFYALGGGGIYHRKVELTTPSVGYASVCDPYWYVCYPTLVEVDRIIGDRSSNDFGINLGAGITFGTTAKFYIETRWHYVWGPEVAAEVATPLNSGLPDCSGGCSTNAQYWPITFGVRW